MRKLLIAATLLVCLSSGIGCAVPIYSGDPVRRTSQLIWTSENLRLLLDDWERFWLLDQPSHLGPYRTHGGLI